MGYRHWRIPCSGHSVGDDRAHPRKRVFATKQDIKALEAATRRDIKELEANTKRDMKEMEARLEHHLTLRLGAMIIAGADIVTTLVKLL